VPTKKFGTQERSFLFLRHVNAEGVPTWREAILISGPLTFPIYKTAGPRVVTEGAGGGRGRGRKSYNRLFAYTTSPQNPQSNLAEITNGHDRSFREA